MYRVAVVLALTGNVAFADGRLGESTRGRSWWDKTPSLHVTPIWAINRSGHSFVYEWEASIDGVEIDHERFYELVGRPDLSHTVTLRRSLGALALVGGVAAGALGMDKFIRGHGYGVGILAAGVLTTYVGLYFVITPDPVSAREAQELVLGYSGRF